MSDLWMIREIQSISMRLSPMGRQLREDTLKTLCKETLRALLMVLRDAESALLVERRTFRPFPGGPKIRF